MQFGQLKRREFIAALGGAATWPFVARGQEPGRIYRLAVLSQAGRSSAVLAFFDELRRLGFVEGQNLKVDAHFDVRSEQLVERAAAIVRAAPEVIKTVGEFPTRVAQEATRTIPIVGAGEDMVVAGLVGSLSRPGGNTTPTRTAHRFPRRPAQTKPSSISHGCRRRP
jgi:putative ABC transport system substrate-binding protein